MQLAVVAVVAVVAASASAVAGSVTMMYANTPPSDCAGFDSWGRR